MTTAAVAAGMLGVLLAGLASAQGAMAPGPLRLRMADAGADAGMAAIATSPPGHAALDDTDLIAVLKDPQRCITAGGAAPSIAPIALTDVLRSVVCQSLGVRQGEGLTEQARAALLRAQGQKRPAVNLSVGVDAQRGSATEVSASVRLNWVLFDFGARDAGIRQARESLQAVLDEQRSEVLVAVAQAALLYAAAQSTHGRFDAAATNLRIAHESARVAEARHGAGAATLSERLQSQRALAQARLDHTRAMTQSLAATGTLLVAMGLPAPQGGDPAAATPTAELLLEPVPDVAMLVEEAAARHPRVLAARGRLAEARERVAAARDERWGSVGLSTRAGRITGDTSVGTSASAGIEWTVPLLDRDAWRSRVRDAQGLEQVRAVSVDDAVRQVRLQVWQEAQGLLGEREALRAAEQLVESADAAQRVATERFRLGVGGFSDVLSAQDAAASARFQWVDVRASVLRARWRLATAVGRLGPLAPS